MCKQMKKMTIGLCLLVASVALGGCVEHRNSAAGEWRWTPPARLQAGNSGSSGSVIASPVQADAQYFEYAQGQAPEFDRRDSSLNIASYDSTAGFLGFPEQQRTSIDDYRSYYISTSPNRYIYPSKRKYHYGSGHGHNRRPVHRPVHRPIYRPSHRPAHY